MLKFGFRIILIAMGLYYIIPKIVGVQFHGDLVGSLATSLVFNLIFIGLEWLLGIIAFGINVGTLGLGVFITNGLKFVAGLLMPAAALYGASFVLPGYLKVGNFFPDAVAAGLVLGGLLWATIPTKH